MNKMGVLLVIIHLLEDFTVVPTISIVSILAALLFAGLLRSASTSSQVTGDQHDHQASY
jgi:hypothetical protein